MQHNNNNNHSGHSNKSVQTKEANANNDLK